MPRSRTLWLLFSALLLLTVATSCSRESEEREHAEHPQPMPDTRAADETAIRAASAAWSKASLARDLDKGVSFFTEDAIVMSPHSPMVKGKENIRKGWEQMLAQPGPGLSFTMSGVEVARSGDLAYEYGTYSFATKDKKGKTTEEKGKYVVVWKKQADGSWKAAVDIDNPDQ